MKKILYTALALALPAMMWAFEVHFYTESASAPVASHLNATKVLFGDSEATVVLENGETHPVNIANFDYFAFTNNSGIENVAATQSVEITLAGRTLGIKADKAIETVQVTAANGAVVAAATPGAAMASLSLEQLQPGLYIVSAASAGNVTVKKVILK